MTDPCTLDPCPVCKGTGMIGEKCPYPETTEVKCELCATNCTDDHECPCCEGSGQVTQQQLATFRKWN